MLVAAAPLAQPALAGHTHTINGVYHGLGDGDNSNSYVHPFVDAPTGDYKGVTLYRYDTLLGSNECNCTHAHLSWDTNPNPECQYNVILASSNPFLNWHRHFHHNSC